jgi:hypothetical protein
MCGWANPRRADRFCPFADLRIRDYLTAIRVALECSGFSRREAEARLRHGAPNEKALLVWCWQAMQWHV